MDLLSRFSIEHSAIRIDLYITHAHLNLVAENIVGAMLGKSVRYVVATADYFIGRNLQARRLG